MMRHHHHTQMPAVAAALLGAVAGAVAYAVARRDTVTLTNALHQEVHAQVERTDQHLQQLHEATGRGFLATGHNTQQVVEAINQLNERVTETLGMLMPNRAQPGGEEPPA